MMSDREIQAWERRRAAVHEAGHVLVALHFGAWDSTWAAIWPNPNPGPNDRTWLGCCWFPGLPPSAMPMLAVAGEVAIEAWDQSRCKGEFEVYDAAYMFLYDAQSPTDLAPFMDLVEGDRDFAVVDAMEQVWDLIRPPSSALVYDGGKMWPDLLKVSRALINEAKYASADAEGERDEFAKGMIARSMAGRAKET